ncbi:MAG: sigma-70 family RNA polymerase sigma factor [Solirubrobacteraceae bacterium]
MTVQEHAHSPISMFLVPTRPGDGRQLHRPSHRFESQLEQHRGRLTGYCGRMLGSRLEAEDAVQETLLRAWRSAERFEGRAALGTWLCRIATNVCVDMLSGRSRRPLPVDASLDPTLSRLADADPDPAELTMLRETVRLALVALLQDLPPRQRAVVILREVLQLRASEMAELLGMSVASINSALQRARSTLASNTAGSSDRTPMRLDEPQLALLMDYLEALQDHDIEALTSLVQEDLRASVTSRDLLATAA